MKPNSMLLQWVSRKLSLSTAGRCNRNHSSFAAHFLVLTLTKRVCPSAGMDPDKLIVDEIRIGRAKYLKRIEFKAKGKTGVIRKPYCHIFVFVREIQNQDQFVYKHLKRKRPRWKCGRLN